MFTSVQLCANRKHDILHDSGTMTCPGMSPSQIILTKKRGKAEEQMWGSLRSAWSEALLKIPLIGAQIFPAHTPVHGPRKPDIQNNVNIENISLKTMWNGLIDVTGQHVE